MFCAMHSTGDDDLNERSSGWSHMLGIQIPSIQGFGASNFHRWHKELGGDLETSHWKVFEKGMKVNITSHIRVCSSTTYNILLARFGASHRIICRIICS